MSRKCEVAGEVVEDDLPLTNLCMLLPQSSEFETRKQQLFVSYEEECHDDYSSLEAISQPRDLPPVFDESFRRTPYASMLGFGQVTSFTRAIETEYMT